jgi:hypothetical protein
MSIKNSEFQVPPKSKEDYANIQIHTKVNKLELEHIVITFN